MLIETKHHSSLPGLLLDTHTQYFLADGTRTLTGPFTNGVITLTTSSGEWVVQDGATTAWVVTAGGNDYFTIDTNSEIIILGNAVTDPAINFPGNGLTTHNGNVTIDILGATDAILTMDGSSSSPGTLRYESDNNLFLFDKSLTILAPTPILVFQDSNSAGASSIGYIEWRDSGGGRAGFLGNNSAGNDDLYWMNEQEGNIVIQTTGAGTIELVGNTNVTGTGDFSKNVIVNSAQVINSGLTIKGYLDGSPPLGFRGGHLNLLNPGGSESFVFVNENNQFVWKASRQLNLADVGVAYINCVDGSASFAGGNFDIAATGVQTQLSASGGVTQTFSGAKTLTDNTAIGFVEIALESGGCLGGTIHYTLCVDDETDLQSHSGELAFVAVNKVGTVTSDTEEQYSPATEAEVRTAGTLTDDFAIIDGDGSPGKITITCDADSSLNVAAILYYTIELHSANVITAL